MKKTYQAPKSNIINFSSKDIITVSGGGNAILPDDEFYSVPRGNSAPSETEAADDDSASIGFDQF